MLTQESLRQFYGTQAYHRWSILFRNCVLTDGALHVAEAGGAYWLMDLIASQCQSLAATHDNLRQIQFWKLTKTKKGCVVECRADSDQPVVFKQKIEYTDFPLDSIDIWVQPTYNEKNEKIWVLFLKSEY